MTKHDQKLHPGEYHIFRRYSADGKWELYCRDNDFDCMRIRFDYWKAECPLNVLKVGEGIRLYAPDCTLMEEFILVDKREKVSEVTA